VSISLQKKKNGKLKTKAKIKIRTPSKINQIFVFKKSCTFLKIWAKNLEMPQSGAISFFLPQKPKTVTKLNAELLVIDHASQDFIMWKL